MGLVLLSEKNRALLEPGIVALEAGAEYPLGHDFFRLDHGADYFAFFRRLGRLRYYAWVEKDEVVAVAAAVLREVPLGKKRKRTWYLCDLKVRPDFRGKNIPVKMLRSGFLENYLRCQRGYAISMNPADAPNRVTRILGHFRWAPLKHCSTLLFWSLDSEGMRRALPLLQAERGPVSFLSLSGVKDLVLKSTGTSMPLLHAQFGPFAHAGAKSPQDGAVHMFCAPDSDPLAKKMKALGLEPSASASVIAHRMAECDWRWVLTSDI